MALTWHSGRRGFLGFLTYITGSDSVSRGGVIPAMVQVDSAGVAVPAGTVGDPLFISGGGGGGGAVTIADGADVAEGAKADAAYAGSGSASLIAISKGLYAAMVAPTPAGTAIIGKVGLDPAANAVVATGPGAAAATPVGNPNRIAYRANSALPTAVTAGQTTEAWGTLNGAGVVAPATSTNPANGTANNASMINAINGSAFPLWVFPSVNNGATWDMATVPNLVSRIASAAATTNATSAKASSGKVHTIRAYNTTAAVKFLKIYNKASAPTVGTDTPVLTYAIPPNASLAEEFPNGGLYFATGIAYALTGLAADADTTALTAGDVVGLNISYS